MLGIRIATAADEENILQYCKYIGGETDNLTLGPEDVFITLEIEQEF